jgi:diguanylate cyclase (GGDEF)-like protein
MNSIRTKLTLIIVVAIVLATGIAIFLGINATMNVGETSAEQILHLLCETGDKNLDQYFEGIERSVKLASSYIEDDLKSTDPKELSAHVDRVRSVVGKIAGETAGVLTYYYRIDPVYSDSTKGFWYVDMDSRGFTEHEVTDISSYDTSDTSQLVWFTVPKSTGKSVWLPPYVTDNLDVLVLSYNMPIYRDGQFVGVFGIELDYTTLANQVNNIKLYDHGYAFINDKDGNIIYHPYIDVARMAPEDRPRVPEGLLSNKSDIRYEYEGVEKQAVWLELNNGMRLNVTVPVSEINGNWKSLAIKILIVSGFLLIVFIFVALHFTGHITKPLKEFKKVAEQVESGNYDVEMNYHGNDEIGVLSNTFNHMIGNMKNYVSELNRLNDHLKEDNLTLEAATTKDSLTGVRNRFALRRDYELYEGRDIHIMMVDIDDFKKVNDNYGHSVGDYLLKKMGDSLLDVFGFEYSYRYGGDEFLVIVPDMKDSDFRTAMDQLQLRLDGIELGDQKMPVHFSAGYVYGRTTLKDDLRLMLRQADELLYKTKGAGKHGFTGQAYDRKYAVGLKKRAEEDFRRG